MHMELSAQMCQHSGAKRKWDYRAKQMQLVSDGDPAAVRHHDEELQKARERNI
jgi:hypothetical protein